MNLRRTVKSLGMELQCFLRSAYPPFVTSMRPSPHGMDNVPVFMFHTVQQDVFEAQLRFLAENGYNTITCDEYHAFLAGASALRGPSVMLTFDDGERSLYRVAHPLLLKYGMKAVNFIVTGRVFEDEAKRPREGKQWLTWAEVLEMHGAGTIDFQSHTLLHETMFVSEQLVDFLRPGLFTDGLLVDRPLARVAGRNTLLLEWGTPIYDMSPRMAGRHKFHDDEALRDACIHHVKNHGGEAFFSRQNWLDELKSVWKQAKANKAAGVLEDDAARRKAILESLVLSRELLEKQLQLPVRHLAYPWASGSALAVELSREAGYLTNFWGPLPGRPVNKAGDDPFYSVRLKDDYVSRLPGKGRKGLAEVLLMKAGRRRKSDDIY